MDQIEKEFVSEYMEKILQATTAEQVMDLLKKIGADCSWDDAKELARLNLEVMALDSEDADK